MNTSTSSIPDVEAPIRQADISRIAGAAFVGTALEWYDYFVFGTAAALVFERLFFTKLNPTSATLAAPITIIFRVCGAIEYVNKLINALNIY